MYKPRCCLTMSGEEIGRGRCDDTKCGWGECVLKFPGRDRWREGGELKGEHRKRVEQ